ncbi:MAG: hypothetical protein Q8K78_06960 [Planctomycetaceae bacterium]|nr:hypothetical protein [Planctomycetaceae bacterium]
MSSPSTSGSRGRMQSVWLECYRLLHAWWAVDRIRVSPMEGELLRLQPSSILRIDGMCWTVATRWVCEDAIGPFVRYQCDNGAHTATLEVRPSCQLVTGDIRWTIDAESCELHPAEIEVYACGP